MQIFVSHQGRNTTVSVGEELAQLLGLKLCGRYAEADQDMRAQFAKHAIRVFAANAPVGMDGGLSHHIQRAIIHSIAAPELIALLPASTSSGGQVDFAALTEQAISEFLRELVAKNNRELKALAELTRPRVRRPKRKFGVLPR